MTGEGPQSGEAAALDTQFRLGRRADEVYAVLVEAHRGLSEEESARLNARLVLVLANQIGDADVVLEAIERCRSLHGGDGR